MNYYAQSFVLVALGVSLLVILCGGVYILFVRVSVRCSDFTTQAAAQELYDSNRVTYSSLNRVNKYGIDDGRACTNLP